MRDLRKGYCDYADGLEPGPPDVVVDYHTKLRRDENASGLLKYYESRRYVRWSCSPPDGAHVDSSDSDDSNATQDAFPGGHAGYLPDWFEGDSDAD
mmetsp:Transcript_29619/g.96876  ORF Transcript_29619/g.96876 Transcript_29619/m.96876 type:complete len:96 (-) Transcript_29619:20-307(-)